MPVSENPRERFDDLVEFLRAETLPGGKIRLHFSCETSAYFSENGAVVHTKAITFPQTQAEAIVTALGGSMPG